MGGKTVSASLKAWFQCIGNWGSMKMLIFMRMARFRQLLLRPYFAWISWCSSLLWLFLPVFETIWSHWSCTNLDLITSLFSSKTRVIWSGNTIYSLNPLTFSVREHYLGKDFSFSEVNGFFFFPKIDQLAQNFTFKLAERRKIIVKMQCLGMNMWSLNILFWLNFVFVFVKEIG